MSAGDPARRGPGPDLTALLLAHRVFRTEFGRLAAALVAPRNERHAELLADQVDRLARLLHHRQTVEEAVIWPALRGLAPHAAPALTRLGEQHERMGPLLVEARDRRLPASRRAKALRSLHAVLCAHLDEEERVALPLLRAYVTVEQHEGWERDPRVRMGVREQLAAAALVASHADPAERARMEAGAPAVVRLLVRWFVEPSYARRRRALYGIG